MKYTKFVLGGLATWGLATALFLCIFGAGTFVGAALEWFWNHAEAIGAWIEPLPGPIKVLGLSMVIAFPFAAYAYANILSEDRRHHE